MSNRARDGFRRIVVFQPRSGWVADMVSGQFGPPSFEASEQYFETGQGRQEPVSRTRRWTIPVVDLDVAHHLRIMQREGCEIQAIGVGFNLHTMWLSSSAVNVVPFRNRAGQLGGVNLVLENSLFETGIWQGENILSGIPWECQTGTASGSDFVFPGPSGYDGPMWDVKGTDAATDGAGDLTVSSSGDPVLEFYFPMGGAVIQNFGTWQGSVVQLDYSGATLSTNGHNGAATGTTDVVEDECWKLQVNVTSASEIPDVRFAVPGASTAPRVGGCIDCSTSTATFTGPPSWSS